jgi:hypothetical protein
MEEGFSSETLMFTYKTMVTAHKQQLDQSGFSPIQFFANISDVI